MARKTLIHKHTNLTTTSGGVLSPKLPTAGTLQKGEIAVNYKNGYETLSIENDLGEVVPFASLEQIMSYVDNSLPDLELSSNYSTSDLENEDLQLAAGDTYEEAFSKLEKTINDNETITAAALTDLDSRINTLHLPQSLDDIPDGSTRKLSDYATTTLLATKQDALVSGTNIKTINNESILGSGNITIQGGSGGDTNVIETVKVNNTALTPDANKAVNIDLSNYDKAPLIIEINSTDTTVPSGTYTNIGNALANGQEVYIKLNGDNYSVYYLKLCDDLSRGRSACYDFSSDVTRVSIWSNNTLSIEFNMYAAYEHNHGDIDNDGTLNSSQAISIANGDRIAITDASSNEKIQKTSITFDGSTTTTALTPKGTWETFLKTAPVTSVNGQQGAVTLALGDTNVIETVKVNGTALTPDANKAVNITSIPASIVAQDATHRFVSDTEKTTWNGKQNALLNYIENNGHVDISTYVSEGDINIVSYDDTGGWAVAEAIFGSNGIELNAKQTFTNGEDEIAHNVTLSSEGFKFDNKQIATTDQIPSAVTESTVSGWGFTKNTGTVTGVKMNGITNNPTNGVVDLGTVLTSFTETDPTVPAWAKAANKPTYTAAEVGALPDTTVIPAAPGTLNTTATTAQSTSSSEALSGNITLHKVAKTGTYNDLIGKPTIPAAQVQSDWNATSGMGAILNKPTIPTVNNATLTIQKNGTTVNTFTANASSNVTANIQVNELPTVSSSDNGKILQVVNGAWALVTPVTVYTGTSTPNSSLGSNGDLYVLTS